MTNNPRVSIGMPLYNAELYLERALNAILSQSFRDFELIISDNASTDRTWTICQDYAARDKRIKLYRNEKNEGITYNFSRVVTLSKTEYFMWASYDDLWEVDFLAYCVRALDENPNAILAFPSMQCHYLDKMRLEPISINFQCVPSNAWQRAIHFLQHRPINNVIIYGVYRRHLLETILPMPEGYGNDSLLLLKAILAGDFIQLEPLLFTQSHVGKRDIRTRLYQYTGHRTGVWRLLRLEWAFVTQLFRITQAAAPNFKVRLQLLWAMCLYCHQYIGWPFSLKLISRYGSLLIPERLFQMLLYRQKTKA